MSNTSRKPDKSPALTVERKRAIVAFGGSPELKLLRYLKPGFRHCFALVLSQGVWVMYNPLSIGTEIDVWPGDCEEQLRHWLNLNGYTILDAHVQALRPGPLPWTLFSCVEAVKRVLGVRKPWILTPWQLFNHLNEKVGKKSLTFFLM